MDGNYGRIIKMFIIQIIKIFIEVSYPNYIVMCYIYVVTFIYLVFRNLLGLLHFIFTGTRHHTFILGLGLVFWISFFE